MKKSKTVFFKCIHDSPELGNDDVSVVSQVFFTFEYNGKLIKNLSAQLRQKNGSNFNEEQIEVGFPEGITGPFNFDAFSKSAKEYFLRLVGPRGCAISIGVGCSYIRKMSRTFRMLYEVEFYI